jgi:type III pantothenate kinase
MKTITVDLGNTQAKAAIFKEEKLIDFQSQMTWDELRSYVAQHRPDQMMVSTVTQTEAALQEIFSEDCTRLHLLQPHTPLPITKVYDTPHTLGADRLAAAVGAVQLFPKENNIVIDMGTCITYDLVDADHRFRGGLIAPGLRLRFKSMHEFTRRLPMIDQPDPAAAFIGSSTLGCMQSGVVNGLAAELNGIVAEYQARLTKINVILTGGDAPFFESRLKVQNFVVSELVLIGLNHILRSLPSSYSV